MAPKLVSLDLLDLFKMDRAPGPHVSHAIKRVLQSTQPDRFSSDSPPNQLRMNLGNALEQAYVDAVAKAYPDQYTRPGPLEYEGHTGTPDLWFMPRWATVEIKMTWASSRRAEDIGDPWFWHYWTQLKSYCHMAGQDTGILVICFVNGNYRYGDPEGEPTMRAWEDTWDPEELLENWQMIKAYGEEEAAAILVK